MIEIECLRVEPANTLQDTYFKKLVKDLGNEIQFLNWEKPEVKANSPLILLADKEHLPLLKEIIEKRSGQVVIALNARKDFKLVSELKSNFSKVFGFIDLSQEIEYNMPILKNYISLNYASKNNSFEKLASDLDKVYEFTKSELVKIKDLHDRFVKVRVDQLKGATLTSKFMAGEKSGGEFFEIVQHENEILFIQAGSNSYLLSSLILSEIENLKEQVSKTGLQKNAESFQKIISHHASENNAQVTYCLMLLDLKTLQAVFSSKGLGFIFYQGDLISFSESMKLNLKPGEKLCFISEGAVKNWDMLSKKEKNNFFKVNKEMPTKDLINEFFFEVSRNKSGNFLIYDALMAVVEIEEKRLYQLS